MVWGDDGVLATKVYCGILMPSVALSTNNFLIKVVSTTRSQIGEQSFLCNFIWVKECMATDALFSSICARWANKNRI